MVSEETSLKELFELLSNTSSTLQSANLFPRGWTIEIRNPSKGIFIVRDQPSFVEAFNNCFQQMQEAPIRTSKGPVVMVLPSPPSSPSPPSIDDVKKTEEARSVFHMKVTFGDLKAIRSLCGVVYGEFGKYAVNSEGVTCKRCLKVLRSRESKTPV